MLTHMMLFRAAMLSSQADALGTLPSPEPRSWIGAMMQRLGRRRRGVRDRDDGQEPAERRHLYHDLEL